MTELGNDVESQIRSNYVEFLGKFISKMMLETQRAAAILYEDKVVPDWQRNLLYDLMSQKVKYNEAQNPSDDLKDVDDIWRNDSWRRDFISEALNDIETMIDEEPISLALRKCLDKYQSNERLIDMVKKVRHKSESLLNIIDFDEESGRAYY